VPRITKAHLRNSVARIQKTIAQLESFKPEQFDGSEDKRSPENTRAPKTCRPAVSHESRSAESLLPHHDRLYILRHNGVAAGKMDYPAEAERRCGRCRRPDWPGGRRARNSRPRPGAAIRRVGVKSSASRRGNNCACTTSRNYLTLALLVNGAVASGLLSRPTSTSNTSLAARTEPAVYQSQRCPSSTWMMITTSLKRSIRSSGKLSSSRFFPRVFPVVGSDVRDGFPLEQSLTRVTQNSRDFGLKGNQGPSSKPPGRRRRVNGESLSGGSTGTCDLI